MTRAVTVWGYVLLGAALGLRQLSACRARSEHRVRRPATLGELRAALVRRSSVRWLVSVGWLWLGWHLFARVDWS